jgi:hypothetical protein
MKVKGDPDPQLLESAENLLTEVMANPELPEDDDDDDDDDGSGVAEAMGELEIDSSSEEEENS